MWDVNKIWINEINKLIWKLINLGLSLSLSLSLSVSLSVEHCKIPNFHCKIFQELKIQGLRKFVISLPVTKNFLHSYLIFSSDIYSSINCYYCVPPTVLVGKKKNHFLTIVKGKNIRFLFLNDKSQKKKQPFLWSIREKEKLP